MTDASEMVSIAGMDLTTTAYGTWSGGRFMHFGETLSEERYFQCIETAWQAGMRTFVTSDVYGNGKADELLGRALAKYPREEYCLVGMIGHDFYEGQREGNKGYPRFTEKHLRADGDFTAYMEMACRKSLERCGVEYFDLVMLHNPDEIGYTSDAVWDGMKHLKSQGLTRMLGIAPGPANGFTLDLIHCFEKFGECIDWAMLIFNPLEPWPTHLLLPACQKAGIRVLTRVVDYGGVFHGTLSADHAFRPGDHRTYRPEGWVGAGLAKWEKMKHLADKYSLTPLQFSAIWCLSQAPVESVVPTFIQEAGENAAPIEDLICQFANLPSVRFTAAEVEEIRAIGDNTGCMTLKGASKRHETSQRADEWPMREDLLEVARRWNLGEAW